MPVFSAENISKRKTNAISLPPKSSSLCLDRRLVPRLNHLGLWAHLMLFQTGDTTSR